MVKKKWRPMLAAIFLNSFLNPRTKQEGSHSPRFFINNQKLFLNFSGSRLNR